MLAARDQENLVHVHQTAAASKPLNQETKTLQPKTPGNKVPKTPFKIPLNDKIGNTVLGGGKNGGLKARFGGNENLATGGKKGVIGDKTAFVTPLGIIIHFQILLQNLSQLNSSSYTQSSSLRLQDYKCQSETSSDIWHVIT